MAFEAYVKKPALSLHAFLAIALKLLALNGLLENMGGFFGIGLNMALAWHDPSLASLKQQGRELPVGMGLVFNLLLFGFAIQLGLGAHKRAGLKNQESFLNLDWSKDKVLGTGFKVLGVFFLIKAGLLGLGLLAQEIVAALNNPRHLIYQAPNIFQFAFRAMLGWMLLKGNFTWLEGLWENLDALLPQAKADEQAPLA
jgi:hypothetical protein